ncbi:MAG: CDGSH iron-sulfur domain-containing protein [Verrucomicrobia bacterium]|nr:CDGSH iron-sulfur domain-containing protein [Verrucomicrobiota bacterium]
MSNEPQSPQKSPYEVQVEAGQTYWWCACGRSQNQPFCDGTHRGSSFQPIEYKPELSGTVYLCGCKHTATRPLCDGSHKSL